MKRPSFSDLTPEQQKKFGNGVGPYWLPDWARNFITVTASWFFEDASWRHHDFGYVVGGDRWDRARCDWKFLVAMARDAWTQRGLFKVATVPLALIISAFFYLNVRAFGGFGSFEYRERYATPGEVIEAYQR